MSKKIRLLFMTLMVLQITACANQNKKTDNSDLVLCPEERPQVCTHEYNPVCATLKDGSVKTGSTGCTACSDPEVVGYTMGKC